jgi:hypothetical protein
LVPVKPDFQDDINAATLKLTLVSGTIASSEPILPIGF